MIVKIKLNNQKVLVVSNLKVNLIFFCHKKLKIVLTVQIEHCCTVENIEVML